MTNAEILQLIQFIFTFSIGVYAAIGSVNAKKNEIKRSDDASVLENLRKDYDRVVEENEKLRKRLSDCESRLDMLMNNHPSRFGE